MASAAGRAKYQKKQQEKKNQGYVVSMLVWYIRECMVSIVGINDGINMFTRGYHICDTNQLFTIGWVCYGERRFIIYDLSYYLDQFHF